MAQQQQQQQQRRRDLSVLACTFLVAGLILFASTTNVSSSLLRLRGSDSDVINTPSRQLSAPAFFRDPKTTELRTVDSKRQTTSNGDKTEIYHGPQYRQHVSAHVAEEHAFKCCSNEDVGSNWSISPNSPEWCPFSYIMNEDECKHYSLQEANEFCESKGGRLCTAEELRGLCAVGNGCGFDLKNVWALKGADEPQFLNNPAESKPTLVFVIGVEGVGHHLLSQLMGHSPNMQLVHKLGMCEKRGGQMEKIERLMFNFRRNQTGLFNPDLESESFDAQALYGLLVQIFSSVGNAIMAERAGDTSPFYIPINANDCGSDEAMMSYPNFLGDDRVFFSANLDTYYNACRDAGLNCKHVYMYRDPYDVILSTLKREFNVNSQEAIRLYTMELQVIFAQMVAHSQHNVGCFGFLDVKGSKRIEDVDRFGELFGWKSVEDFRSFYSNMNNKKLVEMKEKEKLKLVPPGWRFFMQDLVEIHNRVVDFCYSNIAA